MTAEGRAAAPPRRRPSTSSGCWPPSPLVVLRPHHRGLFGPIFLLSSAAALLAAVHTIRVMRFAHVAAAAPGGEAGWGWVVERPFDDDGGDDDSASVTTDGMRSGAGGDGGGDAPIRRRVIHLTDDPSSGVVNTTVLVPSDDEAFASYHGARRKEKAVHSTRSKSSVPPPPVPKYDAAVDSRSSPSTSPSDCVPYTWQTLSFPTCNDVHEVDMGDVGGTVAKMLGTGGIRDVWKIVHNTTGAGRRGGSKLSSSSSEAVALKTLKLSRPFSPFFHEMHRRDALAMERLTSSSHVVDVHGYCGQSAINGLVATDGKKRLRGSRATDVAKLEYARDAALALADVHGVDVEDGRRHHHPGTIVHGDITMSNYVLSSDRSTLQLSDFNQARFLSWNNRTHTPCGYRRLHCTAARSPEECFPGKVLTEKTDVYTLGHVLYFLLSAHLPYRYPTKIESRLVRRMMVNGTLPQLPHDVRDGTDPATVALREAMERCYTWDARSRPGAAEIASDLTEAIEAIRGGE